MTKSKTLSLFLSVLMCMALLVSCTSKNTQDKETDDVQITGDYIYKSDTAVRIIYNGNYRDEAIQKVQRALRQHINQTISIAPDTQEKVEHEIIIGKSSRELSHEAYRRLDMHETDGENYIGYVIYSDGKSLALAYDEDIFELDFAMNKAVDILIDKYLDGEYLQLKKGVVYEKTHDLIAEQEEADKILVDEAWGNLLSEMKKNMEEEQAMAIHKSLKNCYEIFSDDVITWFANLYDPQAGAYYYSNSGRNTVGYGPDLESTYQALSFMGGTGMADTVAEGHDVIPEWMQEQIVKFIKSLQDKNGYFYHPQWGGQSFAERRAFMDKNYASRLGRDLKHAENMLRRFGAKPTYKTPTGMAGDGLLADGTPATVATARTTVTGKLGVSTAIMVSKVVAVSSDDGRKHLESAEEMLKYLNALEFDADGYLADSYYAGNLLESQTSQIVARDKVLDPTGNTTPLATTIKDFFDAKQNQENGAWTGGDEIDYESVNGILKISGVYNGIGQEFPNPIKAIRTAMLGITMEEPPTTVCFVLNPWYAITMIIQNVEKYNSSPDKAQVEEDIKAVRAQITKNAVELIDVTRDKSAKFRKADGSFSYFPGTSGPNSQGVPVAVVGSVEGDVNATYMFISGIPNHIFGILGYDMVPLFTTVDRMRYWQILNDLGGIIKDDVLPPEPNDFEHEDIDTLPAEITAGLSSAGAFAKVVQTVDKDDKETKAVALYSSSGAADIIRFNLDNYSMYYNALSFEVDIKFESGGGSGQVEMLPYGSQGDAYRIIFDYSDGGNVTARTINDFKGVTVGKEGEWIRLRLEYSFSDIDYDRNGTKDLLVKLYANNKYLATGYTPAGTAVLKEANVSGVRFSTWSASNVTVYFDNLLFMQDTVTLDPAPVVNAEDESETITFEQSKADNIPGKISTSDLSDKGSITVINRTDSEKTNKALGLISAQGGADTLKFYLTKPSASAYNAVAFTSDMMIDSESGSFEYTFVTKFNSIAANLVFEWNSDGVTVKAKNAAGTAESAVKIAELGKWFRVRIEFYGTPKASLIRVLVGENVLMSTNMVYNTYHSARNVNSAKLAVKSDTEAEIYFDNLTYEQFGYVDEGASDTDTDGITFEDVTAEGLGALMTVTTTDKAALDIVEDLRDGIVTKSLRLTSPKSSVDSIALKCKAENADETNTVVFESNIKISNADGGNFLNIYLKDKDGNTAYKLMWGWSAGTGNVFAQDITAAGARDFSEVLVSEGIDDYFRLRVEYTKISDTEILGKIYINGVLVEKAKSITPFGTSAIDADDITEVVLETDPGRGATFYFDNIKIDYAKTEVATPTPPTPPTPPVTPDVPTEPGDRADTDPFDNDPESSSTSGGWT